MAQKRHAFDPESMEWVRIKPPRPAPKANKKWSEEETAYLAKAVMRGDHLFRIADLLGRTYHGVLAQLQKMRFISWEGNHIGHRWIRRKITRVDTIPRTRDTPFSVRGSEVEKLYRIASHIRDDGVRK